MEELLNLLASSYLGALETGARSLATYSIGILGIAALISFHQQWWPHVLHGGSHMGEALGAFVLMLVSLGFYWWLLTNLWEIGDAVLSTMINWGLMGAGNTITVEQVRNPGFITRMGWEIAFPLAEDASWWQKAWTVVGIATSPTGGFLALCILAAFAAIAVHHLFMLIEFYLALTCGHVLIGWGIWRPTATLGEFGLSWLVGCLVRALVSCVTVGLSVPLFSHLRQPQTGGMWDTITYVQMAIPVIGAFIFAIAGWIVPARAARLVGSGLGLTGSTLGGGAMTLARFGMMVHQIGGAIRGSSRMVQQATR